MLIDRHGVDGCRLYLEQLRWPAGVLCPRCESSDVHWLERRRRHNCRQCRYQFRVTAGTVFHDSHLSLRKWFVAVQLMLDSERGTSALQLSELLGGSYKSAWFLEHRIRSAMARTAQFGDLVAYAGAVPPHGEPAGRPIARDGGQQALRSWPILKSLIAGAHRNVGVKYLSAYWNEVHWRDSNRTNPNAFRDTVLALLEHPWLPYDELTGAVEPAASTA